jgi:HK97 family phage major capsid protein
MEVIIDKLENMNNQIRDLSTKSDDRISKLENAMSRPALMCEGNSVELKAFGEFIRSGMEYKSLSGLEESSGGYTIIPELYKDIMGHINAKSVFRKLASIERISTNSLDILLEKDNFDCNWEKEGAARNETNSSKLAQKRISVHELYAQPKATQKLLDDSEINITSWLSSRLADSFLRAENKAFINGDGDNKPKGILSYVDTEIEQRSVAEEGKITFEDILDFTNILDETYLSKASFLMHRSSLLEIQKLKDNNGRFLWQPSLTSTIPGNIFGIPVYTSSDMPIFEAGKVAIAMADFSEAYKIVDRSDISIMRDPFTEKPFVKFYSVKRVGGDVVNTNAIKLLKC